MAFTWTAALETGHPVIDSQHNELIDMVNKLISACQQGMAADKVGSTVDFLVAYTKKHFADEEALQQKSNYPDYANHRASHATFVQVITDLSAELKQTGSTPTVINKIIRNVGDWLVTHIQQQDVKMATHVKNAGA